MSIQAIREALTELHLPTIKKRFEDLAQKAIKEGATFEQYLHWLVEEERADRKENRVARRLAESKIPSTKTWENFDFKRLPLKLVRQFRGLLSGEFLKRRENILLFGTPGGGKTHLLCALSRELIRQYDCKILFLPSVKLVQDLLLAKRDLALSRLIKKLTTFDGIIIDDIGYVQQSKEEMDVLFTLISECYEKTSVLLTSNLPFSHWEKIFKDPMTAAAAIDRLVHYSVVMDVNVPSYRMEKSKEKHTELREAE